MSWWWKAYHKMQVAGSHRWIFGYWRQGRIECGSGVSSTVRTDATKSYKRWLSCCDAPQPQEMLFCGWERAEDAAKVEICRSPRNVAREAPGLCQCAMLWQMWEDACIYTSRRTYALTGGRCTLIWIPDLDCPTEILLVINFSFINMFFIFLSTELNI